MEEENERPVQAQAKDARRARQTHTRASSLRQPYRRDPREEARRKGSFLSLFLKKYFFFLKKINGLCL